MPIEITENGIVKVLRQTDEGNWRTSINPGDTVRAEELLDSEELQQVNEAWTPEVIATWEEETADHNPPSEGPQMPTVEERTAALEDAFMEFLLGGGA